MVLFGEIVEPSSRALWEDDFVEYPEDDDQELEVTGNLDLPDSVDVLLVGETNNIINVLQKCVLQGLKPICEIPKAGIFLYKIGSASYTLFYKPQTDVAVGRITEKLMPWLNVAKKIYVLTSSTITSLQNNNDRLSPCIIKFLSSGKENNALYSRLEVPNLVTGLSASILSYSIHKGLSCVLFISFLENTVLDSINTRPILDLLLNLGVSLVKNYILESKLPSNNLYM